MPVLRRSSVKPGSIRHELDARRAKFCRALYGAQECSTGERRPFYCDLGTLGCTEAHGDYYERPWYVVNVLRQPFDAS